MSILNELNTFIPTSKGSFSDPINHRRNLLVENLKKQISMLDDEEIKGRKWWRQEGNSFVSCIRFSTDIVKFENSNTHFTVDSKERLKEVYNLIIKEVDEGNFDKILEEHWNKSKFNKKNQKH